jgi:hypothetical protein
MCKNATKCNETIGKWCKTKHGASKIIDTFETYQPQQISFGEVALLIICQEHSVFHSYNFNECSLFLELRLTFNFCLDLCSDLVISFHQGVF